MYLGLFCVLNLPLKDLDFGGHQEVLADYVKLFCFRFCLRLQNGYLT